jgi:hypothetical protein
VQSLNYDIETEEERTGCWDCRDLAYSVLARSLTARRDNLAATIAALQKAVGGRGSSDLHAHQLGDEAATVYVKGIVQRSSEGQM